jgi:hypothetical protein
MSYGQSAAAARDRQVGCSGLLGHSAANVTPRQRLGKAGIIPLPVRILAILFTTGSSRRSDDCGVGLTGNSEFSKVRHDARLYQHAVPEISPIIASTSEVPACHDLPPFS